MLDACLMHEEDLATRYDQTACPELKSDFWENPWYIKVHRVFWENCFSVTEVLKLKLQTLTVNMALFLIWPILSHCFFLILYQHVWQNFVFIWDLDLKFLLTRKSIWFYSAQHNGNITNNSSNRSCEKISLREKISKTFI